MVGLGLTATVAGLAKLPSNVLSFFAGPLAGWLTLRAGHRVTVATGGALAAFGWLLALMMPDTIVQIVLLLCVISFGTTILQAAIPNVVVDSVPPNRTSEAIGTMSVVRGIAAAIGAQVIAMMLASDTIAAPDSGALFPTATSFSLTFTVMAVLTFGVAAAAMLLAARGPRPQVAASPA
jgi:MFS family permease